MRARAFSPKRVSGARPGNTTFTRTLNCFNSNASVSLNALTAALLAVYTESSGSHFTIVRMTYERLRAAGVEFTQEPIDRYGSVDAGFRDPAGNGWKMIEAPKDKA